MNYPEYVKIGEKLYKINTDFKVALKCNEVAMSDVREEEKVLAIIYLLYGDEGLNTPNDYEKLIEKSMLYLSCGKEPNNDFSEPDMDFEQDQSYIKASFYTDYQIPDIYKTNMHWWEFTDLMNGLKEDCVLNRVRYIRSYDTTDIKDTKALKEWKKAKESVALKKKEKLNKKQKENINKFLEKINMKPK